MCGTCVWSCAQIPEKHKVKLCFALQNKNTACQFRCTVGKLGGWGLGGGWFAGCQRSRQRRTHLDKSFVSAEE